MSDLQILFTLMGAAILGVVVPRVAMTMLAKTLAETERVHTTNYRGTRVFYGLGVVWLVWAGCAVVGGVLSSLGAQSTLPVLSVAGALALVAGAFGLVDDAYGSPDARGFKGHLKAMARGRLTTGGLKLLGIGFASLIGAFTLAPATAWGVAADGAGPAAFIGTSLMAGAAIALTSNFVNLTDLRPGRALKAYGILVTVGVVSAGWILGGSDLAREAGIGLTVRLVQTLALALFAFGPVVAVWRYDVGERGMLGDAGANPMGVVAGVLIVAGCSIVGLAIYTAIVLALNLASEKWSFSKVIDSFGPLRWLDGLGRSVDARATDES